MDLNDVLNVWEYLGYSRKTMDVDNKYIIKFLKDDKVEGHFTAAPGEMYWDYPQEALDKYQEYKEYKNSKESANDELYHWDDDDSYNE